MDHNLDDSLNLDNTIGSMDFDHSGVVVNQEDITLETTDHESDLPMEFEHIEEQPILMDTGNEEIIVSDFIGEQFTLQEYTGQHDVTSEIAETVEANQINILASHSESMIDLQFDPETMSQSVAQEVPFQPEFIQIKAAASPRTIKKDPQVSAPLPRQVAIAPKPTALPCVVNKSINLFNSNKQFTLAPKPVTLATNNKTVMKTMTLTNVLQSASKTSNSVITQIGKQLVVVPCSGQKIKLVTSTGEISNVQYAQLLTNKQAGGTKLQKPLMGKIIVQGQSGVEDSNQPAVITKLMSDTSATTQTRYVMQQTTVPISIGGNKVIMAPPTKQGIQIKRGIKIRKPIIAIQSQTQNIVPVTSPGAVTTKKVVITSNPSQNVILKTTAPPKAQQVSKEGSLVTQVEKSQLHQINVPGKGIQYIRLITNPTPAPQKAANKPQTPVSFVVADGKVTTRPQRKFVKIAPATVAKSTTPVNQQLSRSSQSLLAPLARAGTHAAGEDTLEDHHLPFSTLQEVEVEFERSQSADDEDSNSMTEGLDTNSRSEDHPLIVIASNYSKQNQIEDKEDYTNIQVEVEGEPMAMPDPSPKLSQSLSDNEVVSSNMHGRKACNCTKSQCLKLYCDCFANGEFCHRCNCNNCHNNLDNEELRQKAIRACLDRNPNAFRPKIGKSKTGGPEIIRRHNKGCNCKRSGCLKNYCECYEAKIACTAICKCVGCRNVEDSVQRRRELRAPRPRAPLPPGGAPPPPARQPCGFMTAEVIDAVCQCLLAAGGDPDPDPQPDPVRDVIHEFARCLHDIISASHEPSERDALGALSALDESQS